MDEDYETNQCDPGAGLLEKCSEEIRKPSTRDRLTAKKQRLTVQLAAVDAGLKALDDNPTLEKFIETIARAS